MCELTKKLPIQGVVGFSEFRVEDLTRGEGKNSVGLRTLLELCFGTSEIKCSASWSYIPDPIIKLLVSVISCH